MMKLDRLRWRLSLPYLLVAGAVLMALGAYLLGFLRQTYLAALQDKLAGEARVIGEAVRPYLAADAGIASIDPLADRYADLLGERVTILRADGIVMGDSAEDPARMPNHLFRPEVQQALAEGQGQAQRYSETLHADLLYGAVPVRDGERLAGYARVAVRLSVTQARLAYLRAVLALAAAAALVVTAALVILIAERLAAPLRRLTQAAERLARGEEVGYLASTGRDEIGRLTNAFDAMAERLRATISALQEERAQLAGILEQMADGVLMSDGRGLVTLVNPAAVRLLRLGDGERVLGRSVIQVVRQHEIATLWQEAARTGQQQAQWIETGAQGPSLQVIASPVGAELTHRHVLLLLQDLSQVRRLETVRREFVSNISHELRTPLAALQALVETLQDGALEDPPAAQRFLALMHGELDALAQMVQELLELARIESGVAPVRLAPERVADLVLPAIERLRPQAERAGLTLTVELPEELPLVLADAGRIQQVIANLVQNAIKFTPTGGAVAVRAVRTGDQVTVAVRDTGVGISAEALPRVFERFYKADRSRAGGGTGLGLAIARHIVEAHGGRIWAESVEGRGSVFTFSMVVAEASAMR